MTMADMHLCMGSQELLTCSAASPMMVVGLRLCLHACMQACIQPEEGG